MPLYEYQCKKCKHRFEKIQKFSDRPLKKCPECGGLVEQLLHAPAVQFKGTGWYVTDYAGKGEKSTADSASEKGASEKKETTAKEDTTKGKDKESKPAKKAESKKTKD